MMPLEPRRSRVGAILLGIVLATLVPPAHADEVSDGAAAADALFQQGRALMSAGSPREACPKFAASYKLDKKLGTLLNWADCLEKDGRVGSAFERFSEAVDWAKTKSDDRLEFATKRRDALADQVPKLTLVVTVGAEKLDVYRDGARVPEEVFGLAVPVDPGPVELEVRRGDDVLERVKTHAQRGRAEELKLDLAAISKAHPKPVAKPVAKGQRTAGFVVGAVGLAGLGVFGVLEGVAYGQKSKADAPGGCKSGFCTPQGFALERRAGDFAEAGQWVGIGGAAVLAVGATLLLTAPRAPATKPCVGLLPFVGPTASGVVFAGEL